MGVQSVPMPGPVWLVSWGFAALLTLLGSLIGLGTSA